MLLLDSLFEVLSFDVLSFEVSEGALGLELDGLLGAVALEDEDEGEDGTVAAGGVGAVVELESARGEVEDEEDGAAVLFALLRSQPARAIAPILNASTTLTICLFIEGSP